MSKVTISSQLLDLNSTIERIEAGDFLIIAADEDLLSQLPSGNWIGGSIPYFMGEQGGLVSKEHIFVNAIEGLSGDTQPRITPYDAQSISRIAQDAPDNGFTITIIPAGTDVHTEYAQNAPSYQNMFFSPLIGWIAGVHLDEVESKKAKTVFGPGAMVMDDKAVAIHVPLPTDQMASIHIVNLFEQGHGPKITFPETGFNVSNCIVDGVETNLADYVKEKNIDTRLPLVADYNGVNVNVSIQNLNNDNVDMYAPVFGKVEYQFATPVPDYVESFNNAMSGESTDTSDFGVNCILNFLYSELEGKQTGKLTGPITFGEIAYQLLNQTLVYMSIDNT